MDFPGNPSIFSELLFVDGDESVVRSTVKWIPLEQPRDPELVLLAAAAVESDKVVALPKHFTISECLLVLVPEHEEAAGELGFVGCGAVSWCCSIVDGEAQVSFKSEDLSLDLLVVVDHRK